MTEAAETDRLPVQVDFMLTRDSQIIFKHLKSLKKSCSLTKLLLFKSQTSINVYDKVNMLNEFFPSVFSLKILFEIEEIEPENSELKSFSV